MSAPSLNEALALMNQQAFPAAAAICRQHLAVRADDFNARHLLGLIEFKAGQLLAATKDLQKASRLPVAARFKAQALSNLALVLQARGRLENACEALQQAIEYQPKELAFHLNLLGALEKRSDWSAIIAHLKGFTSLQQHPEARLSLAVALRHTDQNQQALALLEPVLHSLDAEAEWALNAAILNQIEPVIEYGQQTNQAAYWLTQVADYMAEEGFATLATPVYQAALELEPSNVSVRHMLSAAAGECTAQAPDAYVESLYDQHADAFEERLTGRLGYQAPTLLAERLPEFTPGAINTLLDLGCGTGLCGQALQPVLHPRNLIGCDLSQQMLSHAAEKSVYTELLHADLMSTLAKHRQADLITATDVLIYTGELSPVLQAAFNALAPGGLFAFTLETCSHSEGVMLDASGRYRHDAQKLLTKAQVQGYEVCVAEEFPLRREQGNMLEGALIILRRPC